MNKRGFKTIKVYIYSLLALRLLKTYFGHHRFRTTEQKDAVMTVIEGKYDVFVNMPTGRLL